VCGSHWDEEHDAVLRLRREHVEALTDDQCRRIMTEALEDAGEQGLAEDVLDHILEAAGGLRTSAALWQLWLEKKLRFGWDAESRDLKLIAR
jgi:hypothetical protein